MPDLLLRLGILALILLVGGGLFLVGRLFVEHQRRLALAASPLEMGGETTTSSKARILAFSTADCAQCRTQQKPALLRLQEKRYEQIDVVEIDALDSPELVKRYRVLTVPSTVILNAAGEVQAVNYGFADTHKLEQQVDALLL